MHGDDMSRLCKDCKSFGANFTVLRRVPIDGFCSNFTLHSAKQLTSSRRKFFDFADTFLMGHDRSMAITWHNFAKSWKNFEQILLCHIKYQWTKFTLILVAWCQTMYKAKWSIFFTLHLFFSLDNGENQWIFTQLFAKNLAWPDSMWIFHFSFMSRNYWCSFLSVFFRFQCVLFVCAYYLMQYGNGVIFQGIRLNNAFLKERNFELTQKVINTGLLCLTKYAPSDFTAIFWLLLFYWLKLHIELLTILLTKRFCLYANI